MHSVKKAAKPASQKNKLPVAGLKNDTKVMPQPETPNQAKYEANERRWRAEDALRDIERASKHQNDPKLMMDVKKLAKEKMKALKDIC